MYEEFIKECLITNQSRVYSVIINNYHEKIIDLKPTLFRKWLSKEISVPEEKINLSSLNSALARYKKKSTATPKYHNKNIVIPVNENVETEKEGFTFSSVENNSTKSRTTEL